MQPYFLRTFLLVSVILIAPELHACKILGLPATGQALVKYAEYIVRARAIRQSDLRPGYSIERLYGSHMITFETLEVLKGRTWLPFFEVTGDFEERDDFNRKPVPYHIVRPGGQRGWCHATTYKKGAEYLLFLRTVTLQRDWDHKQITPYWSLLAPTNEQLRPGADPWLEWVRGEIKHPTPIPIRKGDLIG